MAYREPCSSIYLFKGCPCDRSYNNTIYFANRTMQWVYFRDHYVSNSRTKSYTNQYYQRYAKETLRIQENMDNLYEFNYMAFCNDNGFNPLVGPTGAMKVFYCFIDSKEYINENVTEIKYTIDVMQTYYFDYSLGMCMVEREHTLTDYVGDNLTPEDLNIGELQISDFWRYTFPTQASQAMYDLLIYYVPNEKYINGYTYSELQSPPVQIDNRLCNEQTQYGAIYNGIYTGCRVIDVEMYHLTVDPNTFDIVSDTNRIRTIIDALIYNIINECKGQIVNMVQIPHEIWASAKYGSTSITLDHWQNLNFFNEDHTEFYQAKNKKLYSYPYQRIIVSNNNGDTAEYKWEHFSTENSSKTLKEATFNLDGVALTAPEIMLYPTNYRGRDRDYESGILLIDFPKPAWSEDSFEKWWTEHQGSYTTGIMASTMMSALSIIGGIATASGAFLPIGAAASGVAQAGGALSAIYGVGNLASTAARAIGTYVDAKNAPDVLKGQSACSSLRTVQKRMGYFFYNMTVSFENAKIIDAYFTQYGYACKKLKVPYIKDENYSLSLRPHWNYVKNINTVILPYNENGVYRYVDTDVEEQLQEIYNNGITFWMNGEEVGDYSLDNSPVI